MDDLEAIADSNPKQTHQASTAADAARWLRDPDAPEPPPQPSQFELFVRSLEDAVQPTNTPPCIVCGNSTQPAGTCSICPACGETSGCA